MVYSWTVPVVNVPAQVAGEELERIYKRDGIIRPSAVVDDSRPESAPLHGCFEWRDDIAAEKYRETQAAKIIRSIIVVNTEKKEPIRVRAFVHVEEKYHPMQVVVESKSMMDALLESALKDLRAYQAKYAALKKVHPIDLALNAIDEALKDQT